MPRYGHDFYAGQLEVVQGLLQAVGREAAIVMTLYSSQQVQEHMHMGQLSSRTLPRLAQKDCEWVSLTVTLERIMKRTS